MDKERKAIIKNSDMTEDMQQDAMKKILLVISKKNLIGNIIQLGIVLLEEILVLTLLMKLNILFIFILDKSQFYYLNLDKYKNKFIMCF